MSALEVLTVEAEEYLASGDLDAGFLMVSCITLQDNNRKLKEFIATQDARAAYEAMHGGLTGIGCNDRKLIAALCTRTKAQLLRTQAKVR